MENQRPLTSKSSIIIPTTEARIRLMEQKRQESQYSSSLEANINRIPQPEAKQSNSNLANQSNDFYDKDSSKNTTPAKNSPISLKSKRFDKISSNIDNSSLGSTSSLRDNKSQGSKSTLNPFEDDSNNPFANSDDEKPVSNMSSKSNPFDEDADDELSSSDKHTNPFA